MGWQRSRRSFVAGAVVLGLALTGTSAGAGVGSLATDGPGSPDTRSAPPTANEPAPGPNEFGYLTATDDIGRTLPHYGEVSPPREDRYVGLFYFLWLGQHSRSGPHVISEIIAEHPEAIHDVNHPAWGPRGAFHHWGRPLFDYYFSDDAWVLRRHAQMLANAQVDFLVFDTTNAFTYPNVYTRLLEVFDDVRRQGWDVPQVVFYTHSSSGATVQRIYEDLYEPGRFPQLWFRWEGKPMIIGNPDQVSPEVRGFFTFRRDQWPNEPTQPKAFPWISFQRPQEVFYVDGKPEVVPVAVAVHNNFPFSDQPFYGYGNNWSRSFHDGALDTSPNAYVHGYNFAEQWEHALEVDPKMVMVTGWNEWVAQRLDDQFPGHDNQPRPPERPIFFVDQATPEFSRDAEPMAGGYGDNYYLQLVDYIRRFKGLGSQARPSARKSIRIDGDLNQWSSVQPTYRDFVRDTVPRDHVGFGGVTYTDDTGRNDFEVAKVARDDEYVYFYARTAESIVGQGAERNWMSLFLNLDGSARSGWKGYEYVVNRTEPGQTTTTLERTHRGWAWREVGEVAYRKSGRELHVAVPRSMLGDHADGPLSIEFKWADNMQVNGEIMDFYVHGDAAPDGRFSYFYTEDASLTSP